MLSLTARAAGGFRSLRLSQGTRPRHRVVLLLAGLVAVFTTVAIVYILVYESSLFFQHVLDLATSSPTRSGRRCSPMRATASCRWSSGTLTQTLVALLVAIPLGTIIAIYLSEFAPLALRETRQADPGAARRACRRSCTATSRC